jgi:hypothetical protein
MTLIGRGKPTQRHLLGVWNPSYVSEATEATLQLMLAGARDYRAGLADEEDVYVWRGKVRSANRQQPLPHLADILAIDRELSGEEGAAREVHLDSPTTGRSTSATSPRSRPTTRARTTVKAKVRVR